jgi:hypothetical protein
MFIETHANEKVGFTQGALLRLLVGQLMHHRSHPGAASRRCWEAIVPGGAPAGGEVQALGGGGREELLSSTNLTTQARGSEGKQRIIMLGYIWYRELRNKFVRITACKGPGIVTYGSELTHPVASKEERT